MESFKVIKKMLSLLFYLVDGYKLIKLLINTFLTSQLKYCSLVWIFDSCGLNNQIDTLHERCLRNVYSDNRSSFKDLRDKDKIVSVHG